MGFIKFTKKEREQRAKAHQIIRDLFAKKERELSRKIKKQGGRK